MLGRSARYLQFDLPDRRGTLKQETAALKNALTIAEVTDRILILPVFHCHKCKMTGLGSTPEACGGYPGDRDACSFLAHFKVGSIDKSKFKYREAMFRHHPWVPPAVQPDDSEPVRVQWGCSTQMGC